MAMVISMSLIRMSNKQKNDIILKIKRREKKIVFYTRNYIYMPKTKVVIRYVISR